jgi:hypothetical protein
MSSTNFCKAAFIHTGPETYLDHLGVLAILLDFPLLVTEEKTYLAAKAFYPALKVQWIEPLDLSLEFLANHFDAIFESGHTWATELIPLIELFFQKKMRVIYCPHGNSDKGYSQKEGLRKDISLIYGPHMRNLLQKKNGSGVLVETGNYRLSYYQQNKSFYDQLVQEKISLDRGKKTLLYAPTWADGENPTSFFDACGKLIEDVQGKFNLIVKLHPFLMEHHPAQTIHILTRYPTTLFLTDFPPIYPLLDLVDAYIGDFSSIAYDFLAFDKPLYFFHTKNLPIHQCGLPLPKEGSIGEFITKTLEENQKLFYANRKKLYTHAFGKEKSRRQILDGIKEALSLDRASWL